MATCAVPPQTAELQLCVSGLSSAVLVGKCQFDLKGRRSVSGAPPSHHSLLQPQLDAYTPQTLTFQLPLSNKLSTQKQARLCLYHYLLPSVESNAVGALQYFADFLI